MAQEFEQLASLANPWLPEIDENDLEPNISATISSAEKRKKAEESDDSDTGPIQRKKPSLETDQAQSASEADLGLEQPPFETKTTPASAREYLGIVQQSEHAEADPFIGPETRARQQATYFLEVPFVRRASVLNLTQGNIQGETMEMPEDLVLTSSFGDMTPSLRAAFDKIWTMTREICKHVSAYLDVIDDRYKTSFRLPMHLDGQLSKMDITQNIEPLPVDSEGGLAIARDPGREVLVLNKAGLRAYERSHRRARNKLTSLLREVEKYLGVNGLYPDRIVSDAAHREGKRTVARSYCHTCAKRLDPGQDDDHRNNNHRVSPGVEVSDGNLTAEQTARAVRAKRSVEFPTLACALEYEAWYRCQLRPFLQSIKRYELRRYEFADMLEEIAVETKWPVEIRRPIGGLERLHHLVKDVHGNSDRMYVIDSNFVDGPFDPVEELS